MTEKWKFYGAPMSYFSAKLRPLLRYKRVPFEEIPPTAAVYREVIKPATGLAFIPVVITDGGEVLQDTPRMIERIEELCPQPAVLPADGALRMVAELIQDFADEAMILPAMYFRWRFDEQRDWIIKDWSDLMGDAALEFAERMSGSLPVLGVTDATGPAIELWFERLLAILGEHLDDHRFLLGEALSLADLAMVGPMYAHLGRDPVPARRLRERAPRVMAWIHEVNDAAPPSPWTGAFELADSLRPLLAEIGRVFVPFQLVASSFADQAARSLGAGEELPRVLGFTEQPILGKREQRYVNAYAVWRHARTARRYRELGDADRRRFDSLVGGSGVLPYLNEAPSAPFVMKDFKLYMDG
ncbi:MAG: glutathione S-transferase family protein [Candidatus Binatia bacterium]